jgi:lysozyme
MSTTWLKTSLALWRQRYNYRLKKLADWKKIGAKTEISKWDHLVGQAAIEIHTREAQLSKANKTNEGTPGQQKISPNGVNFIKQFEGFSGKPYDDGTGVWTIGYGHIEGVTPHSPHITERQASDLLAQDLDNKYAPSVNALHLPFTQNQFDALVSFVYNLGVGTMSTQYDVGRLLRAKQYHAAADAMLQYDHAGGQRLAGLTRRRQAERTLFLS